MVLLKKIIGCIILIPVFFILLTSCSKGSSGSTGVTNPQTSSGYKLKIKTQIFNADDGSITVDTAESLVEISIGEDGYELQSKDLNMLASGSMVFPKDSLLNIKAIRIESKDNPEYNPDEEESMLWLGYSSDEDEARKSEIAIEMTSDKQLTLVVSDDKTVPVLIVNTSLEVKAQANKDGVATVIEGAYVKVDGTPYFDGFNKIVFVKGQIPVFEAILPADNPDIEFAGFKVNGEAREGLVINDIEVSDETIVEAKFIDKTSIGINVSVVGLDDNRGTVQIAGTNLVGDITGTAIIADQQIGTKIKLVAVPKENFGFFSWTIDGTHISSEANYEYIVQSQDVQILPKFAPLTGALTVSIDPRTNYGGYAPNKVAFEYVDNTGNTIKSKGMGETSGPDDLTWNKSEISGIKSGTSVKLKAVPTTGFYPKDTAGEKIEWTGDITGTGLEKTVPMQDKSKSVNAKFTPEQRTVKIDLKKLLHDGTGWVAETNKLDAQGYTIALKGSSADNSATGGTNSSLSKIYKWGEVVTLEIDAGPNYAIYADYSHDGTKTTGNPTNFIYIDGDTPEEGGEGASVDGANKIFKMTFRVEGETDTTSTPTTVDLKHRTVEMKLITSGGKLDISLPEDNTTADYISVLNISDTGVPAQDNDTYETTTYSKDGNYNGSVSPYVINILSGVTTKVTAVAKLGSTFVKYVSSETSALTSTPTLTNGTVKFTAKGNTGIVGVASAKTTFNLTAYFMSPIYEPWIQLKPTIDEKTIETAKTKASGYSYTRTTDLSSDGRGDSASDNGGIAISGVGKKYTKDSTRLKVRHGIPFTLKVDSGKHYNIISIDGKTNVTDNTISITHTNSVANVDIVLKHIVRDVKLNIFGGREDRADSVSKVTLEGTGILASDTTYSAGYRNVSLATNAEGKFISNKAITHDIKILSGIDNDRVKIRAVTSPVHNFHKITGNTNELGAGIAKIEVTPPANLKQGNGTYKTENVYTVKQIPENDTGEINVYFRINSYRGYNNGLKYGGEISSGDDSDEDHKDSTDLFYNKANPRVVRGNIIEVRSAGELIDRYKEYGENFSGMAVYLMNDIYFGKNSEFDGLYNLNGAFYGSGNVVFDVGIHSRAFIHNLNSGAYINGLTVSRGYINASGNSEAGIIGTVHANSAAKYVTNAGVTVGIIGNGEFVGGVVGRVTGAAKLESLGNYGDVKGRLRVGGVIGRLDKYSGYGMSYLFNRGSVSAQSQGNEGSRTGGVVGEMGGYKTRLSKVYNAGTIDGGTGGNSQAGGIVGVMAWSAEDYNDDDTDWDLKIEDFYNTGMVSNGSGIAGVVVGSRDIDDGSGDEDRYTTTFVRGYNIGKFSGHASISWAGHWANKGGHYLNIYDVYFHGLDGKELNSGLGYATWLDSHLDGEATAHRVHYYATYEKNGTIFMARGPNKSGESKVDDLIKGTADMKLDNMKGLKDSANWEDTRGLPDVNGFTSRPTIKGLSEKELLPDWILKPYQD